ncbi:PREDICTED: protein starmaker-like [Prunus mume]|uniref:Protein starmaker-like n=1 Tax=Prunus mume TaxID=102107 RepID=A0ABM0NUY9_PRUMU|nr:PREDICTED: protein starmaker-like [Prunus mume]
MAKGNGNGSSNNSSRGRPYGLMLVMAFGAALLGVMVLHKLRERRIFNLLLKEKDTDLISLHHLLQKERYYAKELKRKNEEMTTKLYSIRTQKMELDRRVLEFKSTIDSLKEELQTMEAALEEKQSEIKMQRVNVENENPQVMELLEILKKKEAEVENLKHHLEYPVKVSSVSTDDPSNPAVNLTLSESVTGKGKTEVTETTEEADRLQESTTANKNIEKARPIEGGSGNKSIRPRQGENTTEVEDQIGEGEGETDRREMMSKQSENFVNPQDRNIKQGDTEEEGQGKKGENFKDGEESNLANAAEAISETNGKDDGNIENSELNESQKLHATPKGGMKLEMQDDSDNSGRSRRVRGKHGFISGNRRKKWRLIAKHRRLENRGNFKNNGVGSVRSTRYIKDDQNGSTDSGDLEDSASNRRLKGDGKQRLEVGKSKDHEAINIQQKLNNRDINKPENSAEQTKSADTQDLPADLEVADAEEQEKHATDDNLFDELSGSNLEEDKEEYREEVDESEF